jgi:hypothetical protein
VPSARVISSCRYLSSLLALALLLPIGAAADEMATIPDTGRVNLQWNKKQLDGVGKDVDVLRAGGVPFEVLVDVSRAPESTLMDESYKVAITRLGSRIRVGGMAEISGFNSDLGQKPRRTLEHSVQGLFPGAGDLGRGTFWSGLRRPPRLPSSSVTRAHR